MLNSKIDLHDYAWKYFQLHADQRLRTFNFYLIICTIISGALTALLKETTNTFVVVPFSLLLPFLSFVFWKLDLRNKQLIGHGEKALKYIEDHFDLKDEGNEPHTLKIFSLEEHNTIYKKRNTLLLTYSKCFHLVFFTFGAGGLLISIWILTRQGL